MPITSQGGGAARLRSGEAERLRSKQPEVAVTDGEGRAPSRPPRNDDTIIVETKVIHMNVPAHRGRGACL